MYDHLIKLADFLDERGLTTEANFVDRLLRSAAEKWIQKAVPKKDEGKFEAWCKNHGFKGVCQGCVSAAAKAGGHAAKMALFAANASGGKYKYPKQKDKK